VELEKILERVSVLLGPTLAHRQIEFNLDSEIRPALVQADADQLQQLFLNLLNNSIDALRDGGSITVALSRSQEAKEGSDKNFLKVKVCDTGAGIPEDRISSIFEPFYTSKKKGKGTGLGLSICKEIVRLHGGRISVESHLGNGTCVEILLPELKKGNGRREISETRQE
jgi:signal transduction histidine kinase